MIIYLAGTFSRTFVITEAMELYLAGNYPWRHEGVYDEIIKESKPYILDSYFYLQNDPDWFLKMRPHMGGFMLDSGAFTYLNGLKTMPNWKEYTDKYARFIIDNKIDLFFELDIDPIIGLDKVEQLRRQLEDKVGRQCIPVWHKSRGMAYWRQMIKNYKYVAIGGLVTREIKKNQYGVFHSMLREARENNCKVHGLGFTNAAGLKTYRFDSVDSTAWLYGNRGGFLYQFKHGEMLKKTKPQSRLLGREGAVHNFCEWLKYANYLKGK